MDEGTWDSSAKDLVTCILTSLAQSLLNTTSYTILYLQAFVLSCLNNLNLIFLSGFTYSLLLISLLIVSPCPRFLTPPSLSCFLWKSGKMRSSGRTKAFQSYNQTFISLPAWELGIVQVRTGTVDSLVRVSPSNLGGPIKSSIGNITQEKEPGLILLIFPPWDLQFSRWEPGRGTHMSMFLSLTKEAH
jgi:hypothetical protein